MILCGLYAITDETLLPGKQLCSGVESALRAGVRLVQYRNKTASAEQRQHEAKTLVALCNRYHAFLLINDDVTLCQQTAAHGVHLGQEDMPVAKARALLGEQAIIGATCHQSLALAQEAVANSANYVAFGRFYPSFTKPGAPAADLSVLQAAKQQLAVPTVAIGGVNAENGAALLTAGADMLAVAHSLFAGPDIHANATALVHLFQQHPQQ